MKNKSNIIAIAYCAIVLILFALLLIFGYGIEEPTIKEHTFDYSITYKFNGETKTINDKVTFTFDHADAGLLEEDETYWTQESQNTKGEAYRLFESEGEVIILYSGLNPHYLMGDPYYEYYVEENGDETEDGIQNNQPYIYYCIGEQEYYDQEEIKNLKGSEIISYEYPQPIKNEFKFSGIDLNAGACQNMLILSVAAVVLSIFIFKKKENVVYNNIDKASFVLNIINGAAFIPFISLACVMWEIAGAGDIELALAHVLPTVAIIGVGISIYLRKKGYSMAGMLVQFLGHIMLVGLIILSILGI